VILHGRISLDRIQRLAREVIELDSVVCGQLFRYSCSGETEDDYSTLAHDLRHWYSKGWIYPDTYIRWMAAIKRREITGIAQEVQRAGQIHWSLDEIIAGSKRIGTTRVDLQARLQTGICKILFNIPKNGQSGERDVVLELDLRNRSPSNSPPSLSRSMNN
jgi:hypothetical protein